MLAKQRGDWIPGVVLHQLGPLTYLVDVEQGRTWRCHINLLKHVSHVPDSCEYDRPVSVSEDSFEEPGALETETGSQEQTDSSSTISPSISTDSTQPSIPA